MAAGRRGLNPTRTTPADKTATATFAAEGVKTRVTAHQSFSVLTPETAPHAQGATQGWNMTMDQMASHD